MTLLLSRNDIQGIINMREVIDAVERAHALHAKGKAEQPVRATVKLPGTSNAILPMAATIPDESAAGIKLLSIFPSNREKAIPVLNAVVVLVDSETGRCDAVLEGGLLTAYRTAAASAVATKHMSRPESKVLGLIGAGLEARTHLKAIAEVRSIETVLVWSRSRQTAEKFATECTRPGISIEIGGSAEEVTRRSDILCTLTPSKVPIVHGGWFKPGLHVNAVGTHWIDFREIDTDAVTRSRVVCDSRSANQLECGDLMIPVSEGKIAVSHFEDELGQVINGDRVGRASRDQITMYQSVGVAIQDVATARLLVETARSKSVGTSFDF